MPTDSVIIDYINRVVGAVLTVLSWVVFFRREILAVVVALWYFRGARRRNRNPVVWSFLGAAVYAIPACLLWFPARHVILQVFGVTSVTALVDGGLLVSLIIDAAVAINVGIVITWALHPETKIEGSSPKWLLDRYMEILLIEVMTILVVDVVWQVFTRYAMRNPSTWTEELATFLMIWVGMLGASVALFRGSHLGIDYFMGKLPARKRLYTEVFVFACIGAFSLMVMLIGGVQLVRRTLEMGQVSPAMGIKMGYVYLAMPISGFFLVLYSVELMIAKVVALAKHRPDGPHPGTETTQAAD